VEQKRKPQKSLDGLIKERYYLISHLKSHSVCSIENGLEKNEMEDLGPREVI
jgi:hypothetical protein